MKKLIDFQRVHIKKGESMKVTYKYNEDDLNLVSTDGSKVLYDGLHFIEATRGHGK